MKLPEKYRGKSLVWWIQTPLYACRIALVKYKLAIGFIAQNGEDRELAKIFKQPRGYCVEVGALDGISISNTYYFEKKKRGWKCLLVEADPVSAAQCAANRPRSVTIAAAATAPELAGEMEFQVIEHNRAMSGVAFDDFQKGHFKKHNTEFAPTRIKVPARTLDSMLEEAKFPRVDFMTIDVEGHEFPVLQGFDIEKWKPKVVVLERIKSEPDAEIARYMALHGYEKKFNLPRDARDDCNDFYFKTGVQRQKYSSYESNR